MEPVNQKSIGDGPKLSRRNFLKTAGAAIAVGGAVTSSRVDAGDVYDPLKGYDATQRPTNVQEVVDKLVELNLIQDHKKEQLKANFEKMVQTVTIPKEANFKAQDLPEIFFDDLVHAIKNGFITKDESTAFLSQNELIISSNKFAEIKRFHRANGRDTKKTRGFIQDEILPDLRRNLGSSVAKS